jgi:hypothetical protein
MVVMEVTEMAEAEVIAAMEEVGPAVLIAVRAVQAVATVPAAAVLHQIAIVAGVRRAVQIVLVHPAVDLQPCLKKR